MQGSDLAGVIEEVGAGVGGFSPGDEVIGFSDERASQAELVLVEAGNLTRKPKNVSWEVAGGLYVAGVTAWGAVHSVQLEKGETVVISGAAGGSARSPSSSQAVLGPRSSAWRARATTSGCRATA